MLFAVESGSRAWGFASADSDFDVRAVAVRPLGDYLRLGEADRDTWPAMLPDDLDVVVWDLRKAAAHWAKGNASVTEWFASPIVYRNADGWLERLRDASRGAFRPESAAWHYAAMRAKSIERAGGLSARMPLKPLCYALRANACVRWILAYRTMPPTRFADVLGGLSLPEETRDEIRALVARKAEGNERDTAAIPPGTMAFLSDCREEIRTLRWEPSREETARRRAAASELERLFQEAVLGPKPGIV